jgi:predicted TIM-barrel fold metal-dependent hydrolase
MFDAHLHVWAPESEGNNPSSDFAYSKSPPEGLDGSASTLTLRQDACNVHGALIVQPSVHGTDHSYISNAISEHPNRLIGCALVDPSEKDAESKLETLLQSGRFRAVRFNPYLFEEECMTSSIGKRLFKRAGELNASVGFMCFYGLNRHVNDITSLCSEFPETTVMLDHFGFCQSADGDDFQQLLKLARFPQVHVKASAFFRVCQNYFPYEDAKDRIDKLIDTFGAERVLWGTDFPFVDSMGCGYEKAAQVFEQLGYSEETRQLICGNNARRLLNFQLPSG